MIVRARKTRSQERAERELTEQDRLRLATLEGWAAELDTTHQSSTSTWSGNHLMSRRLRCLHEAIEMLGGKEAP